MWTSSVHLPVCVRGLQFEPYVSSVLLSLSDVLAQKVCMCLCFSFNAHFIQFFFMTQCVHVCGCSCVPLNVLICPSMWVPRCGFVCLVAIDRGSF